MSATWNQDRFNRTLREYLKLSSRTIPEAINAKAFFIARRAVIETPKAKLPRMSRNTGATLGRIVNKRRGLRGEKGLYGKTMEEAVMLIWAARKRSIAYLKSGWLAAIKKMETVVDPKYRRGAARNDSASKQYGQAKGSAIPAGTGFRVLAIIENAIGTQGKRADNQKKAIDVYGAHALRRAFDFETASMMKYINDKMNPDATRFNRQQRV